MSDRGTVERWQAPFFEQPASSEARMSPDEIEALARAKGFEQGREEGLASGKAEVEAMAGDMAVMLEQLVNPFRAMDGVIAHELTRMAILLSEQIIRRELSISSELITDVVAEAVATLYKLEGEVVVFLNPRDATLVRELVPEPLEGKTWVIVEDDAMSPGGCQVKTPTSFVDASVEKQMELVFANLLDVSESLLDT
ncbi:FliH/SctL family protein [Pseudohalioglobus lutimaris]|uniref:FliH/SctL family protein n=1 Tax=Pseudohalioglobus lutimaris TaxID=1737061 RepID=UPI0013FD2569|nr:FliH/SctL family protein [Pseudohalioglobus lutimaris]